MLTIFIHTYVYGCVCVYEADGDDARGNFLLPDSLSLSG